MRQSLQGREKMKKGILTGALLGMMVLLGTAAFAQSTSGVHIGAQAHFKRFDLVKVLDHHFTLERDMQGIAAYDIETQGNERILIVH